MNEIYRQSIHFLFGIIASLIYFLYGSFYLSVFSLSGLIIGVLIYFSHKKIGFRNLGLLLEKVERDEKKGFSGFLFFIVLLILSVHPFQEGVLVSLLIISISDSLATLVGKRFGKNYFSKDKSLEGSLSFFLSSFVILWVFGYNPFLGLVYTIIEALPFEDNLSLGILGPFVVLIKGF